MSGVLLRLPKEVNRLCYSFYMKESLITYIYVLKDPTSDEVRYVGKTVKPIQQRFRLHIWEAKNGGRTRKNNWIKSLLNQGLLPTIECIEVVEGDSWVDREKHWISHYRKFGNLTNHTDGGEGLAGHRHSEETKLKMSINNGKPMTGKTMPEETKKKISSTLKGREFTEDHKRKISEAQIGREISSSTKEKISDSLKNFYTQNPESKQKLGKYERTDEHVRIIREKTGKLTQEKVDEIRKRYKEGNISQAALGKEYGVTPSMIYNIISGKAWTRRI